MTTADAALSHAERLAIERDPAWEKMIDRLGPEEIERLNRLWEVWRRPGQEVPKGDWRAWLVMAGRGFGKTRMGAEWVRAAAEQGEPIRIALVGATRDEVRRVMVEGDSGLLAVASDRLRPAWEPSLGRLRWHGGAEAQIYSAAEPEQLRGPQHHLAWCDEIAKWASGVAAWDNLMLTMRMGGAPRVMATTTPRPVTLVRRLVADARVPKTYGATAANRAHLADGFLASMTEQFGGTRLARQELWGELIGDVDRALWTRDAIEACRVRDCPELARVVVGVDPPASAGGDACGIVAAGLGRDGHVYVIEDASVTGATPERWARAVAACAARVDADRVVAEKNQGGDMVGATLRAADIALSVTLVSATRGKTVRAEPVSLRYEAGGAHHVGAFPELEDELCGLVAGGGYEGPGRSPDRADALVWAVTELLRGMRREARVRVF